MAKATSPKKSTGNIHGAGRVDASIDGLKRTFLEHLFYTQGRFIQGASLKDAYMALAYTVRDQLLHRWVKTVEKYVEHGIKVVSYLSAEFLLGPHLGNNLINLGLYEQARRAVEEAGFDFQKLVELGQRRTGAFGRLLPRLAGDL
jgi:glycogen phosphorylase